MGDHPMQVLFVSVLLTAFLALTGRRRLRRKNPASGGVRHPPRSGWLDELDRLKGGGYKFRRRAVARLC
jgi:hypothetical protein